MHDELDPNIQKLFATATPPREAHFDERIAKAIQRERRVHLLLRLIALTALSAVLVVAAPMLAAGALWLANALTSSSENVVTALVAALSLAALAIGAQRALRTLF